MSYRSAAFINGTVTLRPAPPGVGLPDFLTASCSEAYGMPQLLRNLNVDFTASQEQVVSSCQYSAGFWYYPRHQC